MAQITQKITPFLWFNGQAQEAAEFYCSVFKNSRISHTSYYNDAMPSMNGKVMTVAFELDGLKFTALNGDIEFRFNESVSFVITCQTQDEIDYYWDKLTSGGGEEGQCGWLKDKFGLSWQVVPFNIEKLISTPEAMAALLKMKKLNIRELQEAAK